MLRLARVDITTMQQGPEDADDIGGEEELGFENWYYETKISLKENDISPSTAIAELEDLVQTASDAQVINIIIFKATKLLAKLYVSIGDDKCIALLSNLIAVVKSHHGSETRFVKHLQKFIQFLYHSPKKHLNLRVTLGKILFASLPQKNNVLSLVF